MSSTIAVDEFWNIVVELYIFITEFWNVLPEGLQCFFCVLQFGNRVLECSVELK